MKIFKSVTSHARGARTQKVRGMSAFFKAQSQYGGLAQSVFNWKFASAQEVIRNIEQVKEEIYLPAFIRPCPVTPRHGFVDSRLVENFTDLYTVALQAVLADPEAELLWTQFIPAKHSAIATPTTFSYGDGHDGATSGKSQTIYGPGQAHRDHVALLVKAGIAEGDVPYIELVESFHNLLEIVQVRGGPPQAVTLDFVPEQTAVKNVIVASEDYDLLQWEKDIASAPEGTVVYSNGMSLASHFCVHAVVHKVPVVTTFKPSVGDTLEASGAPVWTDHDWQRLAALVKEADKALPRFLRDNPGDFAKLSVAGLHIAGTPAPATDVQLRVLAYAVVSTIKLVGATCLGELRHITKTNPRSKRHVGADTVTDTIYRRAKSLGTDRDQVYYDAYRADLSAMSLALLAASYGFNHRAWGSAYGGKAWAGINSGARKLTVAILKFCKAPSATTWAAVVDPWNDAIHRQHNGGAPAYSKFGVNVGAMSQLACYPLRVFTGARATTLDLMFNGTCTFSSLIGPAKKRKAVKREKVIDGYIGVQDPVCAGGSKRVCLYTDCGKELARITDDDVRKRVEHYLFTTGRKDAYAQIVISVRTPGNQAAQAVETLGKLMGAEDVAVVEEETGERKLNIMALGNLNVNAHNIKLYEAA